MFRAFIFHFTLGFWATGICAAEFDAKDDPNTHRDFFTGCQSWEKKDWQEKLPQLYQLFRDKKISLASYQGPNSKEGLNSDVWLADLKNCGKKTKSLKLDKCLARFQRYLEVWPLGEQIKERSGYGFNSPVQQYLDKQPAELMKLAPELEALVVDLFHEKRSPEEKIKALEAAAKPEWKRIHFMQTPSAKAIVLTPGEKADYWLFLSLNNGVGGALSLIVADKRKPNKVTLRFRDLHFHDGKSLKVDPNSSSCTKCHGEGGMVEITADKNFLPQYGDDFKQNRAAMNEVMAEYLDKLDWEGEFNHEAYGPPLGRSEKVNCFECHSGEPGDRAVLNNNDMTQIRSRIMDGTMPPRNSMKTPAEREAYWGQLQADYARDFADWLFPDNCPEIFPRAPKPGQDNTPQSPSNPPKPHP